MFVISRLDQSITNSTEIRYKISIKTVYFKKSYFAFLTKKKCGSKDNFSGKPLKFCPLNCTYIGKISFQCYKRLIRNNEFKKRPIRNFVQCIQHKKRREEHFCPEISKLESIHLSVKYKKILYLSENQNYII